MGSSLSDRFPCRPVDSDPSFLSGRRLGLTSSAAPVILGAQVGATASGCALGGGRINADLVEVAIATPTPYWSERGRLAGWEGRGSAGLCVCRPWTEMCGLKGRDGSGSRPRSENAHPQCPGWERRPTVVGKRTPADPGPALVGYATGSLAGWTSTGCPGRRSGGWAAVRCGRDRPRGRVAARALLRPPPWPCRSPSSGTRGQTDPRGNRLRRPARAPGRRSANGSWRPVIVPGREPATRRRGRAVSRSEPAQGRRTAERSARARARRPSPGRALRRRGPATRARRS